MFLDELLEKVDTSKTSAGADRSNRSKAMVAGVIAGLVVGLMVGSAKQWNLFYAAAGGGLIGAMAGGLLVPAPSK